MKRRLLTRFIIGYFIFGVAGFLAISTITSQLTHNHAIDKEAESMYRQANYLAAEYGPLFVDKKVLPDSNALYTVRSVARYLDSDVMILSSSGEILYDTNGRIGPIAGFEPSISGSSYVFEGDFFGLYESTMLSVIAPINTRYQLKGYVIIHKDKDVIWESADSIFNYNYISMIILLFLALLFLAIYVVYVHVPVRKLTRLTQKYADGDFTPRASLNRSDELGQLGNSLDYMAGEIEKLNDYQSKFIANISHDFRSPLTSIKGYLEAIQDGTIPPEMQEKYIGIVLAETERLNKLTSNLLSLNKLAQGIILEYSDFDINEMIRKIILTFEQTCAKKKIQFELTFADNTGFVTADYGKIQQVMYNLIDNAIKFSNSQSTINISTIEKGEKLLISIKDHGIGIPKDSIEKIFDRFYKTDLSRGKDKKGTGLGLSIVKEILTAHKTKIDVISTEGTGTEFIFSLPLASDNEKSLH